MTRRSVNDLPRQASRRDDSISEEWIEQQLKNFPPGSMDGAIRMLKAFERADRRAAAHRPAEGHHLSPAPTPEPVVRRGRMNTPTPTVPKRIRCKRKEAAILLAISESTLDRLRAAGEIVARLDGGCVFYDYDELVSYAKSRECA
ncbi:hypothetical protein NONO_c73700 [Nocardia nova SH22a]|uniref:Helix-turn-helix domain-containing protein n=1 Tax=Nocardia nova SH22a TaxID=1415166 RepID=W5TY24_9NOCA|nr:helix-turn-helix domain-containing protein [Nocardia nova]AHH22126.1 hypothetical protein NONO_c73700 [Nocardia nova SH22a]